MSNGVRASLSLPRAQRSRFPSFDATQCTAAFHFVLSSLVVVDSAQRGSENGVLACLPAWLPTFTMPHSRRDERAVAINTFQHFKMHEKVMPISSGVMADGVQRIEYTEVYFRSVRLVASCRVVSRRAGTDVTDYLRRRR